MQDLTPDRGELEPIERASPDELRALQLERLRWSLAHAYTNVPHYRAAFDAAGVHPADCKELADLEHFPFTTKADLRDNYPFGMFAVPQAQVSRVHASSGTTGRPTVVGYTAEDVRTWSAVMARSIRAAGGRPGDKVHVAYGYGLFTGGLGAHYGAEALGCTVIPGVRGHDRAAGAAHRRLRARGHHGDPLVHAGHRRRAAPPRGRPGGDLAPGRDLRGRAVDEPDAAGDGADARPARGRHLRPVRGDRARGRLRVRRDQGRPARLGGPLLPGDHRPRDRAGAAGRAGRRAALAGLVKGTIGVAVTVAVVDPGGIERWLGKAQRIVDNRPPR